MAESAKTTSGGSAGLHPCMGGIESPVKFANPVGGNTYGAATAAATTTSTTATDYQSHLDYYKSYYESYGYDPEQYAAYYKSYYESYGYSFPADGSTTDDPIKSPENDAQPAIEVTSSTDDGKSCKIRETEDFVTLEMDEPEVEYDPEDAAPVVIEENEDDVRQQALELGAEQGPAALHRKKEEIPKIDSALAAAYGGDEGDNWYNSDAARHSVHGPMDEPLYPPEGSTISLQNASTTNGAPEVAEDSNVIINEAAPKKQVIQNALSAALEQANATVSRAAKAIEEDVTGAKRLVKDNMGIVREESDDDEDNDEPPAKRKKKPPQKQKVDLSEVQLNIKKPEPEVKDKFWVPVEEDEIDYSPPPDDGIEPAFLTTSVMINDQTIHASIPNIKALSQVGTVKPPGETAAILPETEVDRSEADAMTYANFQHQIQSYNAQKSASAKPDYVTIWTPQDGVTMDTRRQNWFDKNEGKKDSNIPSFVLETQKNTAKNPEDITDEKIAENDQKTDIQTTVDPLNYAADDDDVIAAIKDENRLPEAHNNNAEEEEIMSYEENNEKINSKQSNDVIIPSTFSVADAPIEELLGDVTNDVIPLEPASEIARYFIDKSKKVVVRLTKQGMQYNVKTEGMESIALIGTESETLNKLQHVLRVIDIAYTNPAKDRQYRWQATLNDGLLNGDWLASLDEAKMAAKTLSKHAKKVHYVSRLPGGVVEELEGGKWPKNELDKKK